LSREKQQSGQSSLHGFSPPHFLLPLKPAVFFIGNKNAVAAGTLREMSVKFYLK
jgi:hypothetical protein